MTSNNTIVAHYNDGFFHKSETFIFNYVSNLKNFYPIYFAREFINFDLFSALTCDSYRVPMDFPKRYSWPWLYAGLLRKFLGLCVTGEEIVLRMRKVRLIHAHFAPQGFFALKWRGKFRIPIITNFYGYDVSELPRDPQWAERYQVLFKEGDLFLVEGAFMRSRLLALGCPEHKVEIQRIAIPLDKIQFVPRRAKNGNEKVIFIFSGRFVEKKGLMYALQALDEVCKRHKNFEFRIIGDGPLRPQIEGYLKGSQLSEHVQLLGFLNYSDYLIEMQKADIFIHPSVLTESGDSEGGAPTTILEAQAMGMPIVSTYHADIPNVVVPGKSALLSNERDIQQLADNIRILLENPDQWAEMGRAGRNFVEQHHDINKELINLEAKYKDLL